MGRQTFRPGERTLDHVVGDGEVLIEVFPAKLPGIKEGSLPPTRLTFAAGNKLRLQGESIYSQRTRFDAVTDRWLVETVAPYSLRMTETEARRVAEIAQVLSSRFGEVRLEWYISAGEVYIKDLSVESQPISSRADGVLSPGTAEGEVILLRNMTMWDELAERSGISVVNHTIQASTLPDALPDGLKELITTGKDSIVVAEYPSTGLAVLTDRVKGFIFARGSLLCHLAIVLRERQVPAITLSDALSRFTDGDRVMISDQGVVIIGTCPGKRPSKCEG